MRQIVCLSGEPWSNIPSRTQQLMSRMKDANVLFFEPPASRGDRRWKEPGRKLRPDLIAFTLPPETASPIAPAFFTRYELRRAAKLIQEKLDYHRFREPLLWCSDPAGARFLEDIPHRGVVYDCFRDWSSLTETWEGDLASAADVVFAASPLLARRMGTWNPNVTLLPYGCNYPMFAQDGLPRPSILRNVTAPVFGHFGTLWPDLDLSPLLELAQARPDCALLLVGRDAGNRALPRLLEFPNVRHVGQVETVDLPDYLCHFDVCLHLLRRGSGEGDVISARVFEALSAGRPIVAMLREEQVEHFPEVIYGAHTNAEFVRLCSHALGERGTYARDRRRAYGEANSWAVRARDVNSILESIGLF